MGAFRTTPGARIRRDAMRTGVRDSGTGQNEVLRCWKELHRRKYRKEKATTDWIAKTKSGKVITQKVSGRP